MQTARNLKEYRSELHGALHDEFMRNALDKFAVAYRAGREKSFAGLDLPTLIREVAENKDKAIARMDELYAEFKKNAEAAGVVVHLARDARECNEIIGEIARKAGVKHIVKSKAMTSEETRLNPYLESLGMEVVETDLAEWIIQLRHEGPSHMVLPAIHLSRDQVADLFTKVTGVKQDANIERLVKVARRELRAKYVEADMGISGVNFAVAETGTFAICTNEGNGRLVTTLPRVHVAVAGLDKLMPTFADALRVLRLLPRNATGQAITGYVSWMTGPTECAGSPTGKKEMHIVFLDNGRSRIAKDPLFSQALRCVRCGACANVCPVYRLVGGHRFGHIYIGAIGLILTYFYHGADKAKNLVQNCINCGACSSVCIAGIELPRLIKAIHARIQDEEGHPLQSTLLGKVLKNRKLFHGLLRAARSVQRPVTGGTPYLRHLPMIFARGQEFRALPAIAEVPFRDRFESLRPKIAEPKLRVALFSGCVQDFVYPEQCEAALKILARHDVAVEFPMEQSCCGLPVQMMGESEASRAVAEQNVKAFDSDAYDYIVTLCASCGSHLKKSYPQILAGNAELAAKVKRFSDRIIDFSSFVRDVLGVEPEEFKADGMKTTYHSPCHLCRGLGVVKAPRELIGIGGMEYVPSDEEDVCCGFGGTYSMKFPEVSAELLKKKLANAEKSGAEMLVTDCPGCVMQLRGGFEAKGESRVRVAHIAEALAERLK